MQEIYPYLWRYGLPAKERLQKKGRRIYPASFFISAVRGRRVSDDARHLMTDRRAFRLARAIGKQANMAAPPS